MALTFLLRPALLSAAVAAAHLLVAAEDPVLVGAWPDYARGGVDRRVAEAPVGGMILPHQLLQFHRPGGVHLPVSRPWLVASYGINNWVYHPPPDVSEIQGSPTRYNWRTFDVAHHRTMQFPEWMR